ncbi:hypothetical protein [Massilia sp. BSC265]|uniref:hypothetical protein n=1 Tax=Massilia sp. BSC265 TaxID=1549812 RepID=UPI0004E8F53C|nr:hypothetical protein [Massilia sp. BSC265]KFI06511.1 hypothetical protein JN27_12450 [Massilia sp. BSC265]
MMTSTPVTQQQQTDGRTVREVVEFNQELVNEVWCRRIFRQILQSLELQYAMQMPHRPISPDTVLVLDSGDPMLLPSSDVGNAWSEAGDMHDLAAVVHYAITREYPPAAPLRGRIPNNTGDEYSDTFVTAVDRCLSPDPQQRPHTIEQLRNLLGIVPLGPPVPAQPLSTPPEQPASFLDESAPVSDEGGPRRWLLLVAAATVLLAALGALFALLHQADSRDTVTLALPGDAGQAPQDSPAHTSPAPEPAAAPAGAAAGDPAALAATGPADLAAAATPADSHAATIPPASTAAPDQPAAHRAVPAAAGATYKLVIKPWGMVQVNGVDYGASPPLKRLTLAPGQHTIRIVNPSFPEHTVTVNAVKGGASVIEMDFTEEEVE